MSRAQAAGRPRLRQQGTCRWAAAAGKWLGSTRAASCAGCRPNGRRDHACSRSTGCSSSSGTGALCFWVPFWAEVSLDDVLMVRTVRLRASAAPRRRRVSSSPILGQPPVTRPQAARQKSRCELRGLPLPSPTLPPLPPAVKKSLLYSQRPSTPPPCPLAAPPTEISLRSDGQLYAGLASLTRAAALLRPKVSYSPARRPTPRLTAARAARCRAAALPRPNRAPHPHSAPLQAA